MKVDPAVFEKMLPAEQVFEEILPYLETLDAQIGGIIQLLKDKGITTTAEFARYAQRGDDAGNVRERGMRARMEYLFSSAAKRIDD
ncbi:MAG: hypothetical protein WB799_23315 [Candidatus Sulfotelmatobacter sp.]|jgi:hypothetical protein